MPVRLKIFCGCLLLVAIIVSLGLVTRGQERELGSLAIDVYDNALVAQTYLQDAQTDFVRLSANESRAVTPFSTAAARGQLNELTQFVDVARERAISDGGRKQANALRGEIARLYHPLPHAALIALLGKIDTDFDTLVSKYAADGFVYRVRSEKIIAATNRWLLIAIGLATALALAISIFLGQVIVPPILRAVEIAKSIAGGKLDNHIVARGRSETARLLSSLAVMQAAIAESARNAEALQRSEAARLTAEFDSAAAKKASQLKSEFLGTMSHELRTPLNAILGFSEIIKDQMLGPVTAQYAGYAKDIHVSGHHLLNLINDVLDISKIEAGKVELRESNVAIGELIADTVTLVRGQAAAARVEIHVNAAPPAPVVRADERLLRQVFLNLLANAVKFTPPGGSVTTEMGLVDGRTPYVSISDTGIGMSPEEVEIALTPFGQVDSKLARANRGTGLGLPISRSLMQLHGGNLIISSTPGAGTTVIATLPPGRLVSFDTAGDYDPIQALI